MTQEVMRDNASNNGEETQARNWVATLATFVRSVFSGERHTDKGVNRHSVTPRKSIDEATGEHIQQARTMHDHRMNSIR